MGKKLIYIMVPLSILLLAVADEATAKGESEVVAAQNVYNIQKDATTPESFQTALWLKAVKWFNEPNVSFLVNGNAVVPRQEPRIIPYPDLYAVHGPDARGFSAEDDLRSLHDRGDVDSCYHVGVKFLFNSFELNTLHRSVWSFFKGISPSYQGRPSSLSLYFDVSEF